MGFFWLLYVLIPFETLVIFKAQVQVCFNPFNAEIFLASSFLQNNVACFYRVSHLPGIVLLKC